MWLFKREKLLKSALFIFPQMWSRASESPVQRLDQVILYQPCKFDSVIEKGAIGHAHFDQPQQNVRCGLKSRLYLPYALSMV